MPPGNSKPNPHNTLLKFCLKTVYNLISWCFVHEKNLNTEVRKKVALFCNVDADAVVQSIDVSTIYEVPLLMQKEKLDVTILRKLGLSVNETPDLRDWKEFVRKIKSPGKRVKVALVGKYVELQDSYKSILESFIHAGSVNNCKVEVECIHSERINEENVEELLIDKMGILVAPGFGERGIEGKILAAKYARENQVPYLGICYGMQLAVVEFARNVLGMKDANSTEIQRTTSHPVIDLMEEQKGITMKGGTMRLGSYPCVIKKGTNVFLAYGKSKILERHRHRYEFNNQYIKAFEKAGMVASGINPDTGLVEIMEIPAHPWFVGVQFHPEYRSTVSNPHPLFVGFIAAAIEYSQK